MEKKIRELLALIVCAVILYGGLMPSATVSVSAAAPIKSTINMAKTKNAIITKGNRYKMKAVIKKKTVTTKGKWTSSNKKVATVAKNGVITAIKSGKTTIKVTYKGKSLKTVVKVKATCVHRWKVTKKATCKTSGKKTCSVCGTKESIAKTAHSYKTDTAEIVEGRGKKTTYETSIYCNGCNIDMTEWTMEQMQQHQGDIDGILAGTSNIECFGAGWGGAAWEVRYEKYVKVKVVATYCEYCGKFNDNKTYHQDLYECDMAGTEIEPGTNPAHTYENYCKEHNTYKIYCRKEHKDTAAASNAAVASVATFSDKIAVDDADGLILEDDGGITDSNNIITDGSEDIVISGNGILSGNEIVTENNILID